MVDRHSTNWRSLKRIHVTLSDPRGCQWLLALDLKFTWNNIWKLFLPNLAVYNPAQKNSLACSERMPTKTSVVTPREASVVRWFNRQHRRNCGANLSFYSLASVARLHNKARRVQSIAHWLLCCKIIPISWYIAWCVPVQDLRRVPRTVQDKVT